VSVSFVTWPYPDLIIYHHVSGCLAVSLA